MQAAVWILASLALVALAGWSVLREHRARAAPVETVSQRVERQGWTWADVEERPVLPLTVGPLTARAGPYPRRAVCTGIDRGAAFTAFEYTWYGIHPARRIDFLVVALQQPFALPALEMEPAGRGGFVTALENHTPLPVKFPDFAAHWAVFGPDPAFLRAVVSDEEFRRWALSRWSAEGPSLGIDADHVLTWSVEALDVAAVRRGLDLLHDFAAHLPIEARRAHGAPARVRSEARTAREDGP